METYELDFCSPFGMSINFIISFFLPHSCFTFSSLFLLSEFVAGGYRSKGLDIVQSGCWGMVNNLVVLFQFILRYPEI